MTTTPSNTHRIRLYVTYTMYEMEGTEEASAEIALNIITEALQNTLAGDVEVYVSEYEEVNA